MPAVKSARVYQWRVNFEYRRLLSPPASLGWRCWNWIRAGIDGWVDGARRRCAVSR